MKACTQQSSGCLAKSNLWNALSIALKILAFCWAIYFGVRHLLVVSGIVDDMNIGHWSVLGIDSSDIGNAIAPFYELVAKGNWSVIKTGLMMSSGAFIFWAVSEYCAEKAIKKFR